jgi:hypothetical protein
MTPELVHVTGFLAQAINAIAHAPSTTLKQRRFLLHAEADLYHVIELTQPKDQNPKERLR